MAKPLIDANELPVTTLTDGGYWAKDVVYKADVDAAPTVDAVEVVRCKDCIRYRDNGYSSKDGICLDRCDIGADVYDDDFCSYGERRDDHA